MSTLVFLTQAMESLLFSLKTSLIICAVYACTWDGMIFGDIRAWADGIFTDKLGSKLKMPIYGCIICMASVWGGGIYLYKFDTIKGIIPHVLIVAGINTIISGIIFLAYERNTYK